MAGPDLTWLAPTITFVIAAIGGIFRERHWRQRYKRESAAKADETLKQRKTHLKKMLHAAQDNEAKKRVLFAFGWFQRGIYIN